MGEHNHSQYLDKIRRDHQKREQKAAIGRYVAGKVKQLFGKEAVATPTPEGANKSLQHHPYIKSKEQSIPAAGKHIDIAPPRPTPTNKYIQAKREAYKDYQYTNQRQKVKAPYPTR